MTKKSEMGVAFDVLKGLLNEDLLKGVFTVEEATSDSLTLTHNNQNGKYIVAITSHADADNRLYEFMVEVKFISNRPEFSPAIVRYEQRRFSIVDDEEFKKEMGHCLAGIVNDFNQKIPRHCFAGLDATFETYWYYRELFEAVCRYSNIEDFILSHNGEFLLAQMVFDGKPDTFVLYMNDAKEALKLFCECTLIQREVKFDSKGELKRLVANRAPYLTVEEVNNDTLKLSVTSEFKRVVFTAFLGDGTGSIRTQIEVDGEYKGDSYKPVALPLPTILANINVVNFILDEIEHVGNQISAEHVGLLSQLKDIADKAYALLTEEEKQTYRVQEPTLIYPKQTLIGETYPYLSFGKGVGLTVRKYEHGYYLDIATPTEPLLYLGIKYDPDKKPTETFVRDVVGLMELVHSRRLEALAKELDVGLRVSDEILEHSNDKTLEVRITFGKCQAKLEGVLFMKASKVSVNRALHPDVSLGDMIRDFVVYCRDIESHVERYK